MITHALAVVVLPAGVDDAGRPRANLYLSPRLGGAARLSDFPDWSTWTARVRRHGLRVTLTCDGVTRTLDVDRGPLRPELWAAIFGHDARVDAFPAPDLAQRLVVSYPSRDAHDFVRWAYRTHAVAVPRGERGSTLLPLLEDLVFRDAEGQSTLDATLSRRRVQMWQAQEDGGDAPPTTLELAAPLERAAAVGSPPGDKPPNTREMVERLALYHRMPPAPNRPDLPHTPDQLAELVDFHRALTALTGYPSLLPALGLVFPVVLPPALAPASPRAGTPLTIAVTAVHPGWTWAAPPDLLAPRTAFVRDPGYEAAPAAAAGPARPADVVDGFLALTPDDFQLTTVDVDGGMLTALALADSLALVDDPRAAEQVLPALRSGGLSLLADGRAQQVLAAVRDNSGLTAALADGTAHPLTAPDLTRGYRLDVFDERRGHWRSLHRRDGTYRFGDGTTALQTQDEEGFTQLAVMAPAADPTRPEDPVATAAGAPQPGTDLYVHERIARWNGWSLSAPRPGRPLNRSADPDRSVDDDPTAAAVLRDFRLQVSFAAHAGSLPALRFGHRYRLRARAVDVAGRSVPLSTDAPDTAVVPADGRMLPYLRFEPVPPPTVVLRTLPGPGGSLLELVIRSTNTDPGRDGIATDAADERHLAPPRTSVLAVEQHGMLDDADGRLRADAATFALVTARDEGQIPVVGTDPREPGPRLAVPYFPDPLARGAVLADLPGTAAGTVGVAGLEGVLAGPPDPDAPPGSVTLVPFGGGPWPDTGAFRIRLVEGRAAPVWDGAQQLTVALPKAGRAAVRLSSLVATADLDLLGVWDWIRDLFVDADAALLATPDAGPALVTVAGIWALLTARTRDGANELVTPSVPLLLTHAVQQPLGVPTFLRLPIVHDPAAPIAASTASNAFTPVTAWRSRGAHHAVLLGALQINRASTEAIDLEARWIDWLDDLDEPGPTRRQGSSHVERIPLTSDDDGPVTADGSGTRRVAVYVKAVDALWFAAPFDHLDGVPTPAELCAPVHRLDDTKHRTVRYRAVASSRFAEYFPADVPTSRTGPALTVDVPSSARPEPPDVSYVVPTFGWVRETTDDTSIQLRRGNGLRVYLHRPWFSSGAAELLGVVLWPVSQAAPDDAAREAAKALITQWGADPIWASGTLPAVPGLEQVPSATRSGRNLTLPEGPQLVDAAGHRVGYDADRRLWYCDIELTPGPVYAPFVRLALARYQPHSIPGVELSSVVLTDFAQLAPDRAATLTVDPTAPEHLRLVVGGVGPAGPTRSVITATVEARRPEIPTDLGWAVAAPGVVQVVEDAPAPDEPGSVLFSAEVRFARRPPPGAFRVVVREFEILPVDPPPVALDDGSHFGARLVYAAILELDHAPHTP